MSRRPCVTLITDFGTADHYAGTMKGVILNINPDVQIVDICHQIAPYDIFEAAYALVQSYRFFPPDTIHLVVVDPGVGTGRRPILASTGQYRFVAPDNGALSLLFAREENARVWHITADHYFLNPVSNTFHGRDIFAPVAGWLSKGLQEDKFGEPITDYVRFSSPETQTGERNPAQGHGLEGGHVWKHHHQHQSGGRPGAVFGEPTALQNNHQQAGNHSPQFGLLDGQALGAFCHRGELRIH